MKHLKKYIAIALLSLPILLSAQQKWTLQQCVDTALLNNRNVKQQVLTSKTKTIAYEQARQNLLPNLNASASQNWNFGRSLSVNNTYQNTNSSQMAFGVSSNLVLFDGLKMKYSIDARRADVKASDADLEKIKKDIITSVAAGFLQVLLNKELLQVADDQLGLTKFNLMQRKALIASGKMAEGEIYELQAQESKEELNKLRAENSLKLSLLDLAQIIEIDRFENFDVMVPANLTEYDLQILSADEVYRSALTHRPEIIGAEYRLKSSENNVLISKSAYYPTLSLGAQVGTGYYKLNNFANNTFSQQLSDNMSNSIGFNLQIPIFNKFTVRNNVRVANYDVESSKLNIDNAKLELKKTVQQAYFSATSAKSSWEAAQKSEIASKEAYRFTNQKYDAGRATVYELYQAKNNLTQVLSESVQAKYEYYFRIKILELLK